MGIPILIERLVFKAIISFIVTALSKAKEKVDWKAIKIGAEKHVRDLVPGTWFDDQAVSFVNSIIDTVKEALSHGSEIKDILSLISKGDVQGAIEKIKDAVIGKIGHVVPFAEKQITIKEMLA